MTLDPPNPSDLYDDDRRLDQAVAALRDGPVPPGPSADLLNRTRDVLHRRNRIDLSRTWLAPRPGLLRLAAGFVLALGLLIVYRAAFHPQLPEMGRVAGEHRELPPNPAHFGITPGKAPGGRPDSAQPVKSGALPPAVPALAAMSDGVVSGRVWFDGPPPTPNPLPASNLLAACQHEHGAIRDESLLVDSEGGVANVVVSVSSGLAGWLREEFPPPPGPAVLDQKGCVFKPHVVALMVGEPLLIKNSDPFLHNVHVMAVNNPEANLGQPTLAETATEPFESPEVFRVKCDIHPWMQAWVRVVDNPYFAVTGRDGRFSLRGLPPGNYTLKAWHEQLGVREMQITIGPGKTPPVDFVFKPAP